MHKINKFITAGLLVSSKTKNYFHKKSLKSPTASNLLNYRTHRNIYNSTLRLSKIQYFESNLEKAKSNPPKNLANSQ